MKPVPAVSDHAAYTVEEPGDKYLFLLDAAREVASQIVRTTTDGLGGAAAYIHRASQELVAAVPERGHGPTAPSGEFLYWYQAGRLPQIGLARSRMASHFLRNPRRS